MDKLINGNDFKKTHLDIYYKSMYPTLSNTDKEFIDDPNSLNMETSVILKKPLGVIIYFAIYFIESSVFYLKHCCRNNYVYAINIYGNYLSEIGKNKKAIKYYLKAVNEFNHASAKMNLGILYFKLRDYPNAEKYLDMYYFYHDTFCNLDYFIIRVYGREFTLFDKAIQIYTRAIDLGHKQFLIGLGDFYYNFALNESKAEKCYLDAINYDNITASKKLIILYKGQKKYDLCVDYYKQIIHKDVIHLYEFLQFIINCVPKRLDYYFDYYQDKIQLDKICIDMLYDYYKKTQNTSMLEHFCSMILKNDRIHMDSKITYHTALGIYYGENNIFDKAEEIFIKYHNKEKICLYNLIVLYTLQKRYAEAEYYCRTGIDENDPLVILCMARIYKENNNIISAIKFIEKAYKIDPLMSDIVVFYSELLIKINKKEQAKEMLFNQVTKYDEKATILYAKEFSDDPEISKYLFNIRSNAEYKQIAYNVYQKKSMWREIIEFDCVPDDCKNGMLIEVSKIYKELKSFDKKN